MTRTAQTKTGGRDATTRSIPPKLALAVGTPSTPAPPGWRWTALTDLARLESGHTPSRRHPEYWNGEIPWLSIRDAKAHHGGWIADTEEHTNRLGIANSSARVLPAGTVCLSRTASVGYVVVLRRPMATSQDFVNWVCSDELDPEFLKYIFLAEGEDILRFASGAVHQTIYFPEAKAFHICHPSIDEQRRIVGILDEAFEGIATARTQAAVIRQNVRALFESRLQYIFTHRGDGWTEKALADLSKIDYGYTESASTKMVGPKFLRITDIQDGRVTWTSVPYCSIEAGKLARYRLEHGDIVFARTGGTTGKSYLVAHPPEAVFASYLIRLRVVADRLLPEFVNLFFQTASYWDSVRVGLSGSTQGGFNATKLGDMRISYPESRQEQRVLVTKMESLSAETQRLESIYQRKLAALDELKRSVLHQAFTGQLIQRSAAELAAV